MLRNRNAELAERLRATSGAADSTVLQDLAAANKRIDKLREQLKTSNRELASYKQQDNNTVGRPRTTRLRVTSEGKAQELEAQLSAAQQQIRNLESAATTQSSSADETGSPLANASILHEEIAVRDKMIATLKHSLEQYGAQQLSLIHI